MSPFLQMLLSALAFSAGPSVFNEILDTVTGTKDLEEALQKLQEKQILERARAEQQIISEEQIDVQQGLANERFALDLQEEQLAFRPPGFAPMSQLELLQRTSPPPKSVMARLAPGADEIVAMGSRQFDTLMAAAAEANANDGIELEFIEPLGE